LHRLDECQDQQETSRTLPGLIIFSSGLFRQRPVAFILKQFTPMIDSFR
jgi:hypothetical protein